jgi:hypothetical protein
MKETTATDNFASDIDDSIYLEIQDLFGKNHMK